MNCPYCHKGSTRVIDSRPISEGTRRRRVCMVCKKRFSTYEILDEKINDITDAVLDLDDSITKAIEEAVRVFRKRTA